MAEMHRGLTEHCGVHNFHLSITSGKWRKEDNEAFVHNTLETIKNLNEIQWITVRGFTYSGNRVTVHGYLHTSCEIGEIPEHLKQCLPKGQRMHIELNVEKTGTNPFSWYQIRGTLTESIDWIDLIQTCYVKLELPNQSGWFLAVDDSGQRIISQQGGHDDARAVFELTVKPVTIPVQAILMDYKGSYIHVDRDYKITLQPTEPKDWFVYGKIGDNVNFKFEDKWLGVKGNAGKMVDEKFEYLQIPVSENNQDQTSQQSDE